MHRSTNHLLAILTLSLIAQLICEQRIFAGSTPVVGLETPLFTTTIKLEMDKDVSPPEPAILNCYVYKNYTFVQFSRPSLRGAESIEIRPKTAQGDKSSLESFCVKEFSGAKLVIKPDDGYFLGSLKNYLFIDCSDPHGGACDFSLFDANNGSKVLHDTYQNTYPFSLRETDKKLSLEYYKSLSQKSRETCFPVEKDYRCWIAILKENNIPKKHHHPLPDCKKTFAHDSALEMNYRTQFSIPVQRIVGKKPTTIYLKSVPGCDLNP
jgi:hypothetical protein